MESFPHRVQASGASLFCRGGGNETTSTATLKKPLNFVRYLVQRICSIFNVIFLFVEGNNPDMIRIDDLKLVEIRMTPLSYLRFSNKEGENLELNEGEDKEVERVEWVDE